MTLQHVVKWLFLMMFIGALILAPFACDIEAHARPLAAKVLKRDARGRIQVMQVSTNDGTCVAEIERAGDQWSRIHVLLISRREIRNIGALLIRDPARTPPSDEVVLVERFGLAMDRCLPFIVRGYASV